MPPKPLSCALPRQKPVATWPMPVRDPAPEERVPFVLASGQMLSAVVRRSVRSRRARLSLSPKGNLVLVIPAAWPLSQARALDSDFLPWLERAWQRFIASCPSPALPERIVLPLAGRDLTVSTGRDLAQGRAASCKAASVVSLEAGAKRILLLELGETLQLFGATGDIALVAEALRRWCRRAATRILPGHLQGLALAHGFAKPGVNVRDQRSRWGSCARTRGAGEAAPCRIQLNWRAILLERPLLDHLCCHELCHMRHMNHSAAYRAELARLSPDWVALERGLSRAWRELPWWALPQ